MSLFIDLILISTPYLPCWQQVVTSNTGPILVFPRVQPFGSDVSSSLGKVYSRQATESVNCENSSVSFVMKYCPTSTVVRNPASVQHLITRSCCDNFSTRSWYLCNSSSSCAGSSVKGVCVCLHHTWHKQWVRLSCHNRSPCSNMARVTFLTHFCDCSVETELINTNNCAENQFQPSPHRHSSVLTIFHHLCSSALLWIMDSWIGRLGVCFLQILSSFAPQLLSHSPCGLYSGVEYHFFSKISW